MEKQQKPDQISALSQQPGGTHYKDNPIQPVEYIHAIASGYCEGNVIKYVTRWRNKNGVQDLLKARHYIDLLIELERLPPPAAEVDIESWQAGEARMEDIGRNGNDGLHYTDPHG